MELVWLFFSINPTFSIEGQKLENLNLISRTKKTLELIAGQNIYALRLEMSKHYPWKKLCRPTACSLLLKNILWLLLLSSSLLGCPYDPSRLLWHYKTCILENVFFNWSLMFQKFTHEAGSEGRRGQSLGLSQQPSVTWQAAEIYRAELHWSLTLVKCKRSHS